MTNIVDFDRAFAVNPLIAILRGLHPGQAVAVGEALVGAGFTLIEVPLNSPEPLESIRLLSDALAGRAIIGAGTVLTIDQVDSVYRAGGQIIVSPNTNGAVIASARAAGLAALPGVATPTEAFAALQAGATALKLFPAEAMTPAVVRAMLAVLPAGTAMLPVGGITPESMAGWWAAGARGFGLGSALFRPGMTAAEVGRNAQRFCESLASLRR